MNRLFPRRFAAVGIDGCKGKWLAVALSDKGHSLQLFDRIEAVCEHYQDADCVLMDMPVGLPESQADIRPEPELRKRLKGKAASVFNTPCRQAVYEADYLHASTMNFAILGKKLSRQSFAITPKIREIDAFLQSNPAWKQRLWEGHPEYCFALLNGGVPLLANKQTPEGAALRSKLLCRYYPYTPELLRLFSKQYPALSAKTDDLLDALALAVTGGIGLKTGFRSIPDCPSEDATAIKMQIVAAAFTGTPSTMDGGDRLPCR